MITIPSTEDRSSPVEFEVEDWEPSWAAAERECRKAIQLISKETEMGYVIATNSRQRAEVLFLVDRAKQSASFWSNQLDDVLVFQNRDAAIRKASALRFNAPHVMTLADARSVISAAEAAQDHDQAMSDAEAGWDGHKGYF